MATNRWIHNFTVTDTQIHMGGYTIYKITSVVFPRSVPQALTYLTIWKRFHDVKRLHRELSRRHKSFQLPGKLPEPTDCSFFKRFDVDIIQRRKEYILQLLDFAAQHAALYKCHAFAQFFSDAQAEQQSPLRQQRTDAETMTGAIVKIYDTLDLHYDSSCNDLINPKLDKVSEGDKHNSSEVNRAAIIAQKLEPFETTKTIAAEEPSKMCRDHMRFLTPMASIESDDSDYIYEAALEFSRAVQAEANLEYKEAHIRYKRGVEVLLNGAKDDANDERKFVAKAKIAKYLARADDIFCKFLGDAKNDSTTLSLKSNLQLSIDISDDTYGDASTLQLERPWNHLAKFKVLQVLGDRVMQVRCITELERSTYVMKGVEKPAASSATQTVFLPQHVPYMVDLIAVFQSKQKIFLLLKQAEGGRLYDYIQTYTSMVLKASNYARLFPEIAVETNLCEDPDPVDLKSSEFNDLMLSSQNLLQSVSNTLMKVNAMDSKKSTETKNLKKIGISKRKIPEASLKQWARELAVAVHSLHAKGVILGDLHLDNLLLGSKGQLMLSYFHQNEGLGSENSVQKAYSSAAVTGHFVAPERSLTLKSDWWSYGVVLYQLLVGLPFKSAHPGYIDMYGWVQFPEHSNISEEAQDLLNNLLQPIPEHRLDFTQIQKHAFFKGTNWDEVVKNGLNAN